MRREIFSDEHELFRKEFRRFADTLSEGCGPGCGTEEAMGQGGCESCTSCAVASACGVKK